MKGSENEDKSERPLEDGNENMSKDNGEKNYYLYLVITITYQTLYQTRILFSLIPG